MTYATYLETAANGQLVPQRSRYWRRVGAGFRSWWSELPGRLGALPGRLVRLSAWLGVAALVAFFAAWLLVAVLFWATVL